MGIKFGNLDATSVKYCDPQGFVKNVSEVRRNGYKIWPTDRFLTFMAQQAGSAVTFSYLSGMNVKYRINYGEWMACPSGTTVTLESVGDNVQYKGNNVVTHNEAHFSMTGQLRGSGDVTSLTNGAGGDATLNVYCYDSMFLGCTSLTMAPALPSTTMADQCYSNMFNGCTSLIYAPELNSTTLSAGCYSNMFNGCTSLISAPELHSTMLYDECYVGMFAGCTSLTSAPDLISTTLANMCYFGIFYGCNTMNTLSTKQSSFEGCFRWLNGVSESGTFHCTQALKDVIDAIPAEERGANNVPLGWTIVVDQD